MDRYSSYFVTSDNQFGFKKNLGCRDAIYAVRNVREHFVSNGSTVNVELVMAKYVYYVY